MALLLNSFEFPSFPVWPRPIADSMNPPFSPEMIDRLRHWDHTELWHPFTPMTAYAREQAPIIVSGEGFYLRDIAGRRYLDGISSLWCNVHGHCVPELDAALRDQLARIAHTTLLGASTPAAIQLAHELVRRTPDGLNHVFFSDAGSTAVEAALKIAVQYHYLKSAGASRRTRFARLADAYHGDTLGSVSVGRIADFHRCFDNLLFPTITVPCPVAYRVPTGFDEASWLDHCYRQVEQVLAEQGGSIAALILEPLVQGAAGVQVHPPGYLRHVRELTKRHGIPLIADEVAVGFGKTGTLFACEQEQVCPDILCLAKGITGGYLPLAATVVSSEIHEAFLGEPHEGRTFYHGHTYTGNALACAVALASLELIEKNAVLENVHSLEACLGQRLEPLRSHPHVGEIRRKGIMVGIELVADKLHKTPFAPELRMGHQVTLAARARGAIIRPLGNVVVLMPAVAMPLSLLEELCDIIIESIDEVCAAQDREIHQHPRR